MHIFVLGHHLGLVTVQVLGAGKFAEEWFEGSELKNVSVHKFWLRARLPVKKKWPEFRRSSKQKELV